MLVQLALYGKIPWLVVAGFVSKSISLLIGAKTGGEERKRGLALEECEVFV